MTTWTEESATTELRALIHEIPALTQVRRGSAPHAQWVLRSRRILEEVFGRASNYYGSLAALSWSQQGPFIVERPNYQAAVERTHQQAYVEQLDTAKGVLVAALYELRRVGLSGVYQGKDTGPESSTIVKVLGLIEHGLRKVIRNQPERERDVQDALETLLVGANILYARETDSIEYSSKTYVPDFTLQKVDLAVEVKLCNRANREKEIIGEINDDILAYRTKYGNVIFVVYDLGFIRDVDRFGDTFQDSEGVLARVVKH